MEENSLNKSINSVMVSIIMPCYNSSRYLRESIQSVLNQTYLNWELIIIDDCSTDNSVAVVESFKDIRIQLVRLNKNNGNPAIPRNMGLKVAKGRFIAFLDSDDIWMPTKLERQITFMVEGGIAICSTSYFKIDEKGKDLKLVVKSPLFLNQKKYMKNTNIGFSSSMIDQTKIKNLQFEPLPIAEDYLFWVETLGKGYELIGLNDLLMGYRIQSKSLSSNKIISALQVFKINYKILGYGFLPSFYYFMNYSVNAALKRIKLRKNHA